MQEKSKLYCDKKLYLILALLSVAGFSFAQVNKDPAGDSLVTNSSEEFVIKPGVVKKHSPKTAAIRSAIFPGLGQIYNKKYWKLPIVYGALGACAVVFIYNFSNYRATRFAYSVKYNMRVTHTDSALYVNIKDNLKPLSEESLRFYRNQFRRDIDYSVLFFLILWGLNVVDASVDAHLQSFDISPDLGLRIRAGYSDMAGTNGVSLVFTIGK